MSTEAHVELLTDQPVRHRVIGATDLNMVVRVDLRLLLLAELVLPGWQRAQRQTIELDKARPTRAVELVELALV